MNTPKNEPSEAVKQTKGNSKKWEDRELIQYAKKIAQNMSWLSVIIDVLALLPLPQEGSGFVEHKMFVNVFLLGQYVPRIFRIHLSAKVFKKMNGKWANGLFNLFLYILAGHVLGVFWYFFSIQRETSCWHEACVKLSVACEDTFCIGCKDTLYCDSGNITARYIITPHKPCPLNTLYGGSTKGRNIIRQLNESCPLSMLDDRNTTARNIIKHLNGSCPLNSPDDALSPFNFGIFLDSLKNENPDQKLGKKFVYSFWWGLRNLSNFGTNLVTSTYAWENLFAILISVIGLLLFIYLIGNVEIPKLKDMDEKVLTMICDYLKPATYVENSFVFRTGDPLDCMLLIIEGTMWTYESSDSHAGQGISSMAIKPLRKGDFYGEELLNCASHCFTEVPVSSKHVKSQTKVEAFLLMAKDLETVLDKFNNREEVEEVEKVARSTFCCFRTNAQRRPTPSPAEIGDDNGEVLPAGN
ncbi:hypothetical protein C1H46_009734 [Malus baccata]|uniref:Cyclic nucleotide-binding domain-containing protein n=1 Tax=Malus baccata TaxID=106549 RepID=A0A540N0S2_MALBA|nr:hypothetical protein C1H46_009734 [Malus baccata]